ncbi:MAG: TerB family tellurite resistance protein [Flavobacteriaceae bacterium]|nr:TerB family tellurite resistance protein [Flavobacteriaceae bacterium]
MASFSRWLGAGLGWTFGGPIGGLIGFALGSIFDGASKADMETFQGKYSNQQQAQAVDFEMSLLVLAAVVIKADKKIDQRELDFVRHSFVQMFGKQRANAAFRLFKGIVANKQISTKEVCEQIRQNVTHASRLQLLHFLFGIAKADTHVDKNEVDVIKTIANYLYISQADFDSIKAMFYRDTLSAYVILEIKESATVTEIKKAYRTLVKKHHPDKLQHLGEAHIQAAREKFLQIQQAYESIQKERRFK